MLNNLSLEHTGGLLRFRGKHSEGVTLSTSNQDLFFATDGDEEGLTLTRAQVQGLIGHLQTWVNTNGKSFSEPIGTDELIYIFQHAGCPPQALAAASPQLLAKLINLKHKVMTGWGTWTAREWMQKTWESSVVKESRESIHQMALKLFRTNAEVVAKDSVVLHWVGDSAGVTSPSHAPTKLQLARCAFRAEFPDVKEALMTPQELIHVIEHPAGVPVGFVWEELRQALAPFAISYAKP